MAIIYFISVWLHILAATIWIGGMLFISLVVVPWMRTAQDFKPGRFLSETGRRFRAIGWLCFAILLTSGTFNLWFRGVRLSDFGNWEWLSSGYGHTIVSKLGLFALILALSVFHDFIIGPRATSIMREDPTSPQAQALRRKASLLGRINALLALTILTVAIAIVRGWP